MPPLAKQTANTKKPPVKAKLTGTSSPFKNASIEEKVSIWNENGGGLFGSEKAIDDEASSHQDVVVTVFSESDLSVGSKSNKAKTAKAAAKKENNGAEKTVMSGALPPPEDSDKVKEETNQPKLLRQRSASTPNIVLVEPTTPIRDANMIFQTASAPARPPMMVRRKYKPPPPGNKLDEELKKASAPPRRVISDGKWVRHRRKEPEPVPEPEPPKKSPSKPKPAKAPELKLGWVRPPLIARKDVCEVQPTKQLEVIMPQMPPIRTLTGKMKKPILHQFVPGAKSGKLNPGVVPGSAAQRAAQLAMLANLAQSSESESDSDTETETDSSQDTGYAGQPSASRPRKQATRISRDVSDDEGQPKEQRTSSIRLPKQSLRKTNKGGPVMQLARSKSEERLGPSTASQSKQFAEPHSKAEVRQRAVSQDIKQSMRRASRSQDDLPLRGRNLSYDASNKNHALIDTTNVATPAVSATPNKVSSWLTATLDPFLDRMKSSKSKPTSRQQIEPERSISRRDFASVPAAIPSPDAHVRHRSFDGLSNGSASTLRQSDVTTDVSYSDQSEDCSSAASTPTLRRSGARRGNQSPGKHRRAPSTLAETESTISDSLTTTSATTSSITDSFVTESIASESSRAANSDYHDPTKRDVTALALKNKAFPSTGRRLSTIASVETLSTHIKRFPSIPNGVDNNDKIPLGRSTALIAPVIAAAAVAAVVPRSNAKAENDTFHPCSDAYSGGLEKSNTIISRRSTRSRRSKANISIPDLMAEIATEEGFYMPELRTLVGGVIKVLFRAVLSKSDAAVAAGLFSRFTAEDGEKEATKTIHEMGVALERLKSYHNRIPKTDASAFLIWALGAHKIYTEYVRTWRLGFQDVVVSLVPADDLSAVSGKDFEESLMSDALPRNADGYVIDDQGQIVDVAFLLKRPLIRLKGLTKSIKALHAAKPSMQSEELVNKYENLMEIARRRVNEEKARMEDQLAVGIDVNRVRDPASLGALAGIKIDRFRCVRARDVFEMHMIHSSGQEIISRVEALIRDNAKGQPKGGDFLLCQSDGHKRWLLLPPVLLTHVSARQGRSPNELVVMVRGVQSRGRAWQELFQLTSKAPEDVSEWLTMLGTAPVPPEFSHSALVKDKFTTQSESDRGSSLVSSSYFSGSTVSQVWGSPEPSGVEVPLGERNGPAAKPWIQKGMQAKDTTSRDVASRAPHDDISEGERRDMTFASSKESRIDDVRHEHHGHSPPATPLRRSLARTSRSPLSPSTPDVGKNTREHDHTSRRHNSMSKPSVPNSTYAPRSASGSSGFSVWMPSTQEDIADDSDNSDDDMLHFTRPKRRSSNHHRSTSLPLQRVSAYRQSRRSQDRDDRDAEIRNTTQPASLNKINSSPLRYYGRQQKPTPESTEQAPVPPPHRTPTSRQRASLNHTPKLTPDSAVKRRSSSPLKHSWRPDSDSERMTGESETDTDSYDDIATSESESEDDTLSRLEEYHATQSVLHGASSEATDDITPSQSASQAPFRDVPAPEEIYLTSLASVSTWNAAEYKSIHNNECLIEIGPGKISAYETVIDTNAPAGYQTRRKPYAKPVVALALTPHVLIQVLNVHDVLISSIPSWDSRFQPPRGQKLAKVRFHTRHHTHRQRMVEAIQVAMHNNPVYQRLERDRPKESAAEMFDRQNPGEAYRQEKQKSWFGGSRKGGSFRKSNTGAGSTVGNTEYSGRTTSSIRRGIQSFLGKTANFNIDRSTIFRRSGDGHTSGRDRDLSSSAPRDAFASQYPDQMNQVLRSTHCSAVRYDKSPGGSRQARRLGKVTLHILHAPRGPMGAVHGIRGPDGIHTGEGHRLVIANESNILVDRVLPPSCFVMDSRGIIVHVFDQKTDDGRVASTGGVGTLTTDLYCLTSFPNEMMRDWLFTTLSRPVVLPLS